MFAYALMPSELALFFESSWCRLVYLEGKLRRLETGRFRPSDRLDVPVVAFGELRSAWGLPEIATRRGLAEEFYGGFERRFDVPGAFQAISSNSGLVRTSLDFCMVLQKPQRFAEVRVRDIRCLPEEQQRALIPIFTEANERLEEELESGRRRMFEEDLEEEPRMLRVELDGQHYDWELGSSFDGLRDDELEDALRENVEVHFGIRMECQVLEDAAGLPLRESEDFRELLLAERPLLRVGWQDPAVNTMRLTEATQPIGEVVALPGVEARRRTTRLSALSSGMPVCEESHRSLAVASVAPLGRRRSVSFVQPPSVVVDDMASNVAERVRGLWGETRARRPLHYGGIEPALAALAAAARRQRPPWHGTGSVSTSAASNDARLPDLWRGVVCLALGRPAEAMPLLDMALAGQRPSPTVAAPDELAAWARAMRGAALLGLGRPEEAMLAFCTTLDERPVDSLKALALALRGAVLRSLGRCSAALEDLDAALALEPHNPFALVDRGAVRMALGRRQEALDDFDAALDVDPHNLTAMSLASLLRVPLHQGSRRTLAELPGAQDAEDAAAVAEPGDFGSQVSEMIQSFSARERSSPRLKRVAPPHFESATVVF